MNRDLTSGIARTLSDSGTFGLLLVAGLGVQIHAANAQQTLPASQDDPAKRIVETRIQRSLALAPATSSNVGILPRAYLTASNGDSKAIVSTGFKMSNTSPLSLGFRIGGETPLANGSDDAAIADWNRISDGTTLSVALQGIFWKAPTERPSALRDWCVAQKRKNPDPLPDINCQSITIAEIEDVSTELYNDFRKRSGWSEPYTFELTGKGGRTNNRFLDAETFAADSQVRVAWSSGIKVAKSFGGLFGLRTGLFSVGYEYQVKYKPNDTTNVCAPTDNTTTLQCRSGPLGPPNRSRGGSVTAEVRGFFSNRFGIGPQLNYLTHDSEWQFVVPLYFVPDKDGGLIGGISPTYSSDGKKWNVRLFVGANALGIGR